MVSVAEVVNNMLGVDHYPAMLEICQTRLKG